MWLFHTDCSLLYERGHHVLRKKQMSVEFFGTLSRGCYHLSVRPWVSRITLWAPKFFSQQWEVQATFLISFGSVIKNPPANAGDRGDVGLIPGLIRSPAGGNDNPLQYSCLENSVDRGAWSLVGYNPWVAKLNTTERLTHTCALSPLLLRGQVEQGRHILSLCMYWQPFLLLESD